MENVVRDGGGNNREVISKVQILRNTQECKLVWYMQLCVFHAQMLGTVEGSLNDAPTY